MARFNIAMLADQAQEVQIQGGDELTSDSRALQVEQTESEIGQMDSAIDEAQDASQAVQDVADRLEQQQQVSEDAVQVAQEMMGYLTKRTGLKARRAVAAMESYRSGDAAKKAHLVAELRMASEGFNEQVAIAQEGVLEKIANKLSLIITSNKGLAKDLDKVSSAYDAGTPREEALEDPAFASVLNPENKESLSAQDIVKFAAEVEKRVTDPKIIGALNKVNAVVEEARNGGIGDEDPQGDMDKIMSQIDTVNKILEDLTADGEVSRGVNKVSIEPLVKGSKQALVGNVEKLLSVQETQDALKQVKKTLSKAGKGVPADIMNAAYSIHRIIGQLMKLRFEVAHACVKYIKASTGKGGAVQASTQEPAAQA